jgi:hypothetical protein
MLSRSAAFQSTENNGEAGSSAALLHQLVEQLRQRRRSRELIAEQLASDEQEQQQQQQHRQNDDGAVADAEAPSPQKRARTSDAVRAIAIPEEIVEDIDLNPDSSDEEDEEEEEEDRRGFAEYEILFLKVRALAATGGPSIKFVAAPADSSLLDIRQMVKKAFDATKIDHLECNHLVLQYEQDWRKAGRNSCSRAVAAFFFPPSSLVDLVFLVLLRVYAHIQ